MVLIETLGMRQRILQEATRLFARSGYSAVSMREISEACRITKAALYYHFENKEDLIVEILTDYLNEVSQIIADCRAAHPTARARLTAFVRAIFAQPVEKRSIIRLATQEMPNLSSETRASFGSIYQDKFIGLLAGILEEGMQRGEMRRCDSHQAVWLLLGMMYPFFYPGEERVTRLQTAIDLMISVFFDGIAQHV